MKEAILEALKGYVTSSESTTILDDVGSTVTTGGGGGGGGVAWGSGTIGGGAVPAREQPARTVRRGRTMEL